MQTVTFYYSKTRVGSKLKRHEEHEDEYAQSKVAVSQLEPTLITP